MGSSPTGVEEAVLAFFVRSKIGFISILYNDRSFKGCKIFTATVFIILEFVGQFKTETAPIFNAKY